MLLVKYLLLYAGIAMFVIAAAILAYDAYLLIAYRRRLPYPEGIRPRTRPGRPLAHPGRACHARLGAAAHLGRDRHRPRGMAGVRVSQTRGTLAGTLYPGVHFVMPWSSVSNSSTPATSCSPPASPKTCSPKEPYKGEPLHVQAKEGLTLGLAITVRYQVDPKRLDYIEANLPQPLEKEIVPPVVATTWRELVPNYTVREVFSAKREEVRQRAERVDPQTSRRRRHRSQRSHAARHRTAAGICEGSRIPAAEGAGERPHGRRDRDPPEASEDRRSRRRSDQGAGSQAAPKDRPPSACCKPKAKSDAMQYLLPLKAKAD